LIRTWHTDPLGAREAFAPLARKLQCRSWAEMAEEIIAIAEAQRATIAEAKHA
jgi:hypothetical protein